MRESSRYAFVGGEEKPERPTPPPESERGHIDPPKKNEDSAPEKAEAREPNSIGADYALLQEGMKKTPELTSSLVDAFHEKLIRETVGANASNDLVTELKRQTWVRLDTYLTRGVPTQTAITKMTEWIKDRSDALKKRGVT